MTIVNVGVSYRFAPAEVLEKLAVPSAELAGLLARLHALPGVGEVAVLSTCHRVEVYAAVDGLAAQVTRAVAGLVAARGRIPAADVLRVARIRVGGAAAEHLFSVACGLDSMAVGEDQIVAQLKAAARAAAAAGTDGPAVTGLINAALRVSKRARTQTTISTGGISLVRAGLDLARTHLGGLAGRDAVVAGTGPTGRLAARLLAQAGAGQLFVASRDAARAAQMAGAVGGRPLLARDVAAALAGADLLVTATAPTVPVLPLTQVAAARARAAGRPLVVLDLGMPANVDPAVGCLAGVTLVDLATLGQHLAGRDVPGQIAQARAIVAAEAAAYTKQQDQAAATPVITAMHTRISQLADTELARLHHRLPGLSDHQRAETAATVHRILRKVLHQPTVRAKEFSVGPNGPLYLDALRQLFDLGPPADDAHVT
jgi:glutamyl-tRNA reductase